MAKVTIDPMTRIEGHMKVEATVDGGEVREARVCGTLFRGFELILEGRHPYDAVRLTQRVCGVCPTAHASASSQCVDSALGVDSSVPDNGRLIRNMIFGCNYLQSHILHFYALAALDYVDVTTAADYDGDDGALKSLRQFLERGELGPFVPRFEGDYRLPKDVNNKAIRHYLEALRIRRLTHEMLTLWGGKMPHNVGIVPGGVTSEVTTERAARFIGMVDDVEQFVDNIYLEDIAAVAKHYTDYFGIGAGCGEYLSYGCFEQSARGGAPAERDRFFLQGVTTGDQVQDVDAAKISESVAHSRYADGSGGHPLESSTQPQPDKEGAYSWLKSPRYDSKPREVGPLARTYVAYLKGDEKIKALVDPLLGMFNAEPSVLKSVLGRHAGRAIECKLVCGAMRQWAMALKPGEPVCADLKVPAEASGAGMTEAPRGALGHWIRIKDGRIGGYQLVVPTTWNGSPADEQGTPGPIEQALLGSPVRDEDNPFELVRIVRSFDPCLACSVHVVDARGREKGVVRIA